VPSFDFPLKSSAKQGIKRRLGREKSPGRLLSLEGFLPSKAVKAFFIPLVGF